MHVWVGGAGGVCAAGISTSKANTNIADTNHSVKSKAYDNDTKRQQATLLQTKGRMREREASSSTRRTRTN